MDRRIVLAESILSCPILTGRYLAGFDDTNHTSQAPGLPNHVAWSLGHCALTMHRAIARLADAKTAPGQGPLPAGAFITSGSPRARGGFLAESVAFGSVPAADSEAYPAFSRCVEIYEGSCRLAAEACRSASDEQLDAPTRWGQGEIPVWGLMMRMVFHNGAHTGQIADLRRGLGLRSIFS